MKRKQTCSSPIRDLTTDYGFGSEITLTVVTNDANGYKRQRRDSEKSLNSSVTLRYKDPKTKAPTEKTLDNDVRHSFDASKELSNSYSKQANEENECYNAVFNEIFEKISPEITIYPKQESEKQSVQTVASTSNKATSQVTNNSQTVYKVSGEVDIISSKSNNKINGKSDCKKVEAIIEAAKKDVPDDNDNNGIFKQNKIFDTNNNPRQKLKTKMNNALLHIKGLQSSPTPSSSVTPAKSPSSLTSSKSLSLLTSPKSSSSLPSSTLSSSTPLKSWHDEKRSNSREKTTSDNNYEWNDIYVNDSMQSISSSIPYTEQLYNFDEFVADNPYYLMGFPNPPGENRCWVNATIHALFALPFTDRLDSLNLPECTPLMKTLFLIQAFWRRGESEKHRIYQMLRFVIK